MKRVLLIDDEVPFLRACRGALEAAGFEVEAFDSGEKALKHLAAHEVDLVVTDILMPDLDGIELMQSIRARRPDIPMVAISGGGTIAAEVCLDFARKLGAVSVLRKPFGIEELVAAAYQSVGLSVD